MSTSNTPVDYQSLYNVLESLCRELDFLADPNIENEMVCTLDCCIGNVLPCYFETLLGKDANSVQNIIGITGLEFLRHLDNAHCVALYYDGKKGFSREFRWIEFREFAERVSRHIKQAMSVHKKSFSPKKYSLEYTQHFMRDLKYVTNQSDRVTFESSELLMHSRFILDNPDEYEGITGKMMEPLRKLCVLTEEYKDEEVNYWRSWRREQNERDLERKKLDFIWQKIKQCAQAILKRLQAPKANL